MKRGHLGSLAAVSIVALGCGGSATAPIQPAPAVTTQNGGPPAATVRPVTDSYHGESVTDPYRWLESSTDPEVKAWADAQNRHARTYLNNLPNIAAIRKELREILADPSPGYGLVVRAGDELYAWKRQPPKEHGFIVVFSEPESFGGERIVVDPNAMDAANSLSIDWFRPSPDGARIAVSMSRSGSERGDLYLFDVATGERLPDFIEYVNGGTAGGDIAWLPDSSGFYYTRYPREGEKTGKDRDFYQQVWFHRIGDPIEKDRYELGKELPRIAEIKLALRAATGEVIATVQNGDGGDIAHFLRGQKGGWIQLSRFADGVKGIFFGAPGELILFTRAGAPRGKFLRLTKGQTEVAAASEIIAEHRDSISWRFWSDDGILVTASRIYVVYQKGGPSELRVFTHAGAPLPAPEQLDVGAVGGLTPIGGDDILFANTDFTVPIGLYRHRAASQVSERTPLSNEPVVDLSDAVVVREMATSADGTQVPVSIIMPADFPRDGSRPCIANGYGGYGVNIRPYYRPRLRILLDRGVCYAIANLRGGGEFGEEWHRAGSLTHKQNVFDDFAAVLRHLTARGYTSASRLGIIGGSNGGLLMGATFVQHPDLAGAVVSAVGIYDMLRVELEPNGEFNVTEFGTVENPDHFRAMRAYSPYHHVKDGIEYPPILFTHGDNDPRVAPWQSRKMTARMQATGTEAPVLLRTSAKSGHGAGNLSEAIDAVAHQYAFLLHHIGAGR